MTKPYSQKHRTDKYSQHSSILWPVWLNSWVFVYELSGCGFKSSCSHLNFRFCACFEQGVPWHSGNYRVWIHSETPMWYDKTIQCYVSFKIGFYFAKIWYTSIFSVLFPDSFLKRSIRPLFCFSSNIDENNDTVHVIEGFVF